MTIPNPVVQSLAGDRWVVRDDLVPGGTKRCYVDHLFSAGEEYVYASPVYGGAQIAIAHAAQARATIFVAKRSDLHSRTRDAYNAGAKIVQVPHGYLNNVQAKARAYCNLYGAILLPFGMNTPDAVDRIAARARAVVAAHGQFDEVWCAAGSGVLCRGLQAAFTGNVHVVQVGRKLGAEDVGRAFVHVAPMSFDREARVIPPFPSCSNYDAKVWEFFARLARGRALFWNVLG